ncbi:MAG: GHKL domain-containing protein, partial [Candidatus Sericytochromatia bacterium]|nr:GHKL domain-containing protein [Candidatus Sericytochromatia bacterium]
NKKESLIDLNDTIEKIKRNLKLLFEDDHVILNYQHLPIIKTDSTYMVQLFQNLISNAIKYRKKDVNPIINISVKSEGNFWLFSINDNGIGINTDYFDKIFIIFQRLHGRSEYEGTGIGLANCKKIIDLYDGKIWVESIEGQGSTFYFTLPTK